MVQVLARRSKNNPILLGDPGVGKTAIAEGLARAIVTGPPVLHLDAVVLCALVAALPVTGTRDALWTGPQQLSGRPQTALRALLAHA